MSPAPDADTRPARSAAILAGGASSRMGRSKATLDLGGRPLIEHAIHAAAGAGLEPFVVAKSASDLPPLEVELIAEPSSPRHPLTGLVAALEHAGEPVVILACDVPLVPPALLAELARREGAVAMPSYPRPQPLVARWSPAALERLREALAGGVPLVDLAAELGGDRLGEAELRRLCDPEVAFANVNEPADLERAERLLRDAR